MEEIVSKYCSPLIKVNKFNIQHIDENYVMLCAM